MKMEAVSCFVFFGDEGFGGADLCRSRVLGAFGGRTWRRVGRQCDREGDGRAIKEAFAAVMLAFFAAELRVGSHTRERWTLFAGFAAVMIPFLAMRWRPLVHFVTIARAFSFERRDFSGKLIRSHVYLFVAESFASGP